jgi:hypothetical protein
MNIKSLIFFTKLVFKVLVLINLGIVGCLRWFSQIRYQN